VDRLPYAIGIPLVAALLVAGIGIPFGILFIEADHWRGPDATLIVALAISLLILVTASVLSFQTTKMESQTPTGPKASKTGIASTAPQANPRTTGANESPRRRSSGGANDRKRK
jgi:hypothetical protein